MFEGFTAVEEGFFFNLSEVLILPSSSSEPLVITSTFRFPGALLPFIFISETEQ